MSATMISCPMCGHRYRPDDVATCEHCPLHSGCNLACCPNCGYETVDVDRSKWARPLNRMFSRRRGRKRGRRHDLGARSLAKVPPGCRANVVKYSSSITPTHKSRLQAYGLVPGHSVQVLQCSPVVVVQVEHTELALETELADEVWVDVE